MQRGPTLVLKVTLFLLGIAALGLAGLLVYIVFSSNDVGDYRPILLGMLLTAIPFFMILYQAFNLLQYIDRNTAFSEASVKALRRIKTYALVISGFYVVCMPYIYYVAEKDDAPGGILIGMILAVAPAVIAVFVAILQALLQSAIAIKSENDLTV